MISVVIPVYNTAQYLDACINSVFAQTYSDLEIIAVDDGSTDGSPAILAQLAQRDPRLRVIRQDNAGVSAARNRGLDEARGEYIIFVDSDDTLEPDLYETLIGLICEYKVDIAHCSYNRIDGGTVKPIGNTGKRYVQTRSEALECFLAGKLYIASCCNKLYARRLFENVRFRQDIKISEDLLVNIALFSKVDRSIFHDVCKYNYLTSETSACRNTPSLKKAADHVAVARELCAHFAADPLLPLAQNRLMDALIFSYKAQVFAPRPDKLILKQLDTEIRSMLDSGTTLSAKERLHYALMRYLPVIYRPLYSAYDRIRVPNLDV